MAETKEEMSDTLDKAACEMLANLVNARDFTNLRRFFPQIHVPVPICPRCGEFKDKSELQIEVETMRFACADCWRREREGDGGR